MEKIKQGDWVIVSGPAGKFVEQISNVNTDTYTLRGTAICYKSQAIKWNPKPDEWCWFWDYLGFTPTIGIYVGREEENFLADIPNGKGSLSLMSFKYCQPLIGEIPSHIKDL